MCGFAYIDSSITKVYGELDDRNAGKNAMLKDLYASKYKVVPVQRIEANIIISKKSSVIFKRTQFPLTLAVVCTVHKVQSLHVSLICLTESHLLPSSNLSGIPTTNQISRNNDEIDKFKSKAVLYNKNSFTCLEQENCNAVLYIKF